MSVICIDHVTKDYGKDKGVFDISFQIEKGETFGFLGPNGAGKTTTMRVLLGFIKAQKGKASILGMDCWYEPMSIQKRLGYLPGEISFPADMTGSGYLNFVADMRGLTDLRKSRKLLDMLNLDPTGDIKRMSKGMKQKLGIVSAFMHDPEVIILDEPTSGLDPLMQSTFTSIITEEKMNGKTILMSSHMFDEVESTCERIGIIRKGRLVDILLPADIRHANKKTYKISFLNKSGYSDFLEEGFSLKEASLEKHQIILDIQDEDVNRLIRSLAHKEVKFISEIKHTLEDCFMGYYKEDISNV